MTDQTSDTPTTARGTGAARMIVVDARNVVVGERLVTQCTHVALCGQQGLVAVLIKTVPPQSVVVVNAQLTDPSAAVSALPVYGEL